MDNSTTAFYEALADDYHLIFEDWQATVLHQGKVLHRLIQQQVGHFPLQLLDCSCGIGTQAIGLAQQSYSVHGTDLSSASVERAKALAEQMDGASYRPTLFILKNTDDHWQMQHSTT